MYKVTIRVVETMATEYFSHKFQSVIDYCVENMIDLTGGATVDMVSMGYWKDASGTLIPEQGHNIWTLCDAGALVKLQNIAIKLKEYGEQDCVLFTVEEMKAVNFV